MSSSDISKITNYPNDGYKDESCTVDDDKVIYSVGLEYPGARKYYVVKLSNVGTIAAEISPNYFIDAFESNTITTYNIQTNTVVKVDENNSNFFSLVALAFQKDNGNYMDLHDASDEDYAYFLDEEKGVYVVRVGASLYFIFKAEWPMNGWEEEGVYYEAKQLITFPFAQYNE